MPAARERSQICTSYDIHALMSPPRPAAKRPLMESRHLPSMPPSGISTQANTYHRTHNQRETHTGNIHKEKLDAHAHTDTPWGREQREDTVMGETDAERLICE